MVSTWETYSLVKVDGIFACDDIRDGGSGLLASGLLGGLVLCHCG